MYHFGSYPDNLIGPVMFSWQPPTAVAGSDGEIEGKKDRGGGGERGGEQEGGGQVGREGERGGGGERGKGEEKHRRLWIWSQPSIYDEVHRVLEEVITHVETGQAEEEKKGERKEEGNHN